MSQSWQIAENDHLHIYIVYGGCREGWGGGRGELGSGSLVRWQWVTVQGFDLASILFFLLYYVMFGSIVQVQ
jgi:hypothetical protein